MSLQQGGEFDPVTLRINDTDISVWKEYSFNSHFLTPTDSWRFTVGDEVLTPELLDLLIPGNKVSFWIGDAKQATGYIDVVDPSGDRSSGTVVQIEGRDAMSPVIDSQIDPDHRYPEKTNLEKLIRDILEPFGFTKFEISNEANVDVAANRALRQSVHARKVRHHRKSTAPKALKRYALPKSKPQHNDSFFQFLCRITQRYGLWIWPTVDGDGVVVGKPNFDQDPIYQIRYKFDGRQNNIIRGGIRRDATDQPSFIVARGNVPPKHVEHGRMRVVYDNPYVSGLEFGTSLATQNEDPERAVNAVLGLSGQDPTLGRNTSIQDTQESGTFISQLTRAHTELVDTWTEVIKAKPITYVNAFASRVARPRYLRDQDSHTQEQLANFAKRQMSLCTRKAFVGKYTIMGHTLDGQPIQVDTVIDVDDERSRFKGPLWIISRTFQQSRHGGTTTEIECIPLGALEF